MAFMPVNYQHPIDTLSTTLGMFIKMLDLVQASLIVRPSIRSRFNHLVAWKA
jgi:hypothetical protein